MCQGKLFLSAVTTLVAGSLDKKTDTDTLGTAMPLFRTSECQSTRGSRAIGAWTLGGSRGTKCV